MIHSIRSNNPNFKTVIFEKGYNVILADRTDGNNSAKKQTRNGAGKTTLIEIIHFCLGSKVSKSSIFKKENLKGWSFSVEIDVCSERISIERFTDFPNKMFIDGGEKLFSADSKYDKSLHRKYVSPKTFNSIMLKQLYGINDEDSLLSFRELVSYAIRKNVDGFRNAFEYFPKQQVSSVQLCNAYFLDLSIEYATEFRNHKEKKKGFDNYKKAIKSGIVEFGSQKIGELNTELITKQKEVEDFKMQLDSFLVHPQYEDISQRVNSLTEQLHELTNVLSLRGSLLNKYEENYSTEHADIPVDDICKIYTEAGVFFGDSIIKSLDEVVKFHTTIITNRKEYLSQEIRNIQRDIDEIKDKMKSISEERAELMKILESHGALAEYSLIQEKYAESVQRLEEIKHTLEAVEKIENAKSNLKIEGQELLLKTRHDYNERIAKRERAVSVFSSNTGALYSAPGTLTIDLDENGYSFDVDIKNSRSQGVNYMKVFCYDLLLMEIGKMRSIYPDFLIHDSTIFDGVDERQFAKALELAYEKCEKLDFQYVCLLNSDMIPYDEFSEEFGKRFEESVRMRISDNQEDGGVLGIRF